MNQPTIVATEKEFRIELERLIDASREDVFEALLEEAGPGFESPDGKSLSLRLEPFPGGRWYRDLGDGAGHCWGFVQSIRAPELLELSGPLFMSLPVANNVIYRLEEDGGTTRITLVHTAFGPITDDMREGMPHGWNHHVECLAKRFA